MASPKLSLARKSSPIEVWLSQANMVIKGQVVFEDESTDEFDVDSLSMRGAQREITGWLISQGYTPVGRWETESFADDKGVVESSRQFKVARTKVEDEVAEVMEKSGGLRAQ